MARVTESEKTLKRRQRAAIAKEKHEGRERRKWLKNHEKSKKNAQARARRCLKECLEKINEAADQNKDGVTLYFGMNDDLRNAMANLLKKEEYRVETEDHPGGKTGGGWGTFGESYEVGPSYYLTIVLCWNTYGRKPYYPTHSIE